MDCFFALCRYLCCLVLIPSSTYVHTYIYTHTALWMSFSPDSLGSTKWSREVALDGLISMLIYAPMGYSRTLYMEYRRGPPNRYSIWQVWRKGNRFWETSKPIPYVLIFHIPYCSVLLQGLLEFFGPFLNEGINRYILQRKPSIRLYTCSSSCTPMVGELTVHERDALAGKFVAHNSFPTTREPLYIRDA